MSTKRKSHTFTAESVRLPCEDPQKFEQHRNAILANTDDFLLEQLINDSWRMRRIWNLETTALAEAMEDVVPELDKTYEEYSEDVRLYAGYRKLLSDTNLLNMLNRIESRLSRSIRFNLQKLKK